MFTSVNSSVTIIVIIDTYEMDHGGLAKFTLSQEECADVAAAFEATNTVSL